MAASIRFRASLVPLTTCLAWVVSSLVTLFWLGCSSSTRPPAAALATCELGAPLPDGSCVTAGVPPDQCGKGFTPDGKQGCEPVLPTEECADGTMPVLGMTTCQPVGVPAEKCGMGFLPDGHAGCDPILPAEDCPAGTMPMIGSTTCQPVGVPADKCGTGFVSDGTGGCEPILPAEDCPVGQMAVPGETVCHEPQPCGTGKYGDIPVDTTTQFVDASYTGGDSNGSMGKPWVTLTEGLAHAAVSAVVAVAEGTYPENVVVAKGVTLWGVCPAKVSITGGAPDTASVQVAGVPTGQDVEIHGLGITGPATGLEVRGVTDVLVAGVRVHDTGGESFGVRVLRDASAASLVLRDSLIESTHCVALQLEGSNATVQSTMIRTTQAQSSDMTRGWGIRVKDDDGQRGLLTLTSSLLDQNHDVGLAVVGSDATVEATVIRNTQPQASDMGFGWGMYVVDNDDQRSSVALTSSLLDRNHALGLLVLGSDVTVDGTVIRNTQPQASDMTFGRGIAVREDDGERGSLTLTSSLLDQNHDVGLFLWGSDATVDGTVIRNTQAQVSDMTFGWGIGVQDKDGTPGSLVLTSSLLDQNHYAGLLVLGSDAKVEATVIRNTQPQLSDMTFGRGIGVRNDNGQRSSLTLTSSLLDQNLDAGLFVGGSDATVQSTVIRNTQPQASDMAFGRGIVLQEENGQKGTLTLTSSLLDHNHDLGVFLLGSEAMVDGTVIRNTQPQASDMTAGRGIEVEASASRRSFLTLTSCLLDQNQDVNLMVFGSDAAVQSTLIRNTQPKASDMTAGRGIGVEDDEGKQGTLTLTSSLLDQNHDIGLFVVGSRSTVEKTVIRNTQPQASDMTAGWGMDVSEDNGQRASLTLTSTLLDQNHEVGLLVIGSDAMVEAAVIRTTQPQSSDTKSGWGMGVQSNHGQRGRLTLISTLVDQNHDVGVLVTGSDVTVQSTVIRNTQPQASDMAFGRGINVQDDDGERGTLKLTTSLLDGNHDDGLFVAGSDATIEATVIQNTQRKANDQTFGDALSATLSRVTVKTSVLRNSEHASVGNFGSEVTLSRVVAGCSPILFEKEMQTTEPSAGDPISTIDGTYKQDQVTCLACDGSGITCRATSSHLSPPKPVPPLKPSRPSLPSLPSLLGCLRRRGASRRVATRADGAVRIYLAALVRQPAPRLRG